MRLRKLKPEVSWSFTEFNDLHPVDTLHRMFLYGNDGCVLYGLGVAEGSVDISVECCISCGTHLLHHLPSILLLL